MRALSILLLTVSLMLMGCDGNPPTGNPPTDEPPTDEPPTDEPPTDEPPTDEPPTDEPPRDGTLVVSTSTIGDDPDLDGYLLMVDEADSLALPPTGSAQVDLAPGRHTLELLGIAEQCSVAPGAALEQDIAPGSTTSVTFEVDCPLTGARITVATTGHNLDPNGYRVLVDGSDHGVISSNDSVLARLEPGSHTIGLTGLAQNCAVDGSGLRTVTVVDTEAVAVEFAVVCTAVGGVIRVVLSGALGIGFEGIVDGMSRFPIGDPERGFFTGRGHFTGVPAGTHVVSLSGPTGCSSEPGPQSVNMPAGAPLRDTVEVTFLVTCVSGLRITTRTTGPRASYYWAVLCSDPWCDGLPFYAGQVGPNGTLVFKPGTDTYWVGLTVPRRNCVKAQNPPGPIQFVRGSSVDVAFEVTCS